jgi:hypothetical protein
MSTLEAFQDPEALRRLIEELVPKGGCGLRSVGLAVRLTVGVAEGAAVG